MGKWSKIFKNVVQLKLNKSGTDSKDKELVEHGKRLDKYERMGRFKVEGKDHQET